MATRTHAREAVISLLYAYDSGNEDIRRFAVNILEQRKIKNAQLEFALNLFDGVIANLKNIDDVIMATLKSWDYSRIGVIDKCIIRLGVYEIMFSKLDIAIIINEALEISKILGSENTTRFVNGILDAVGKNYSRNNKTNSEN